MKKKFMCALFIGMLAIQGCGQAATSTENATNEEQAVETESDSRTEEGSQTEREEASEPIPEVTYVQPEMKGEISVNVYESNEWLDTAIAMFEEKYPDMKVNLHAFYQQEGEVDPTGMTSRPAGQTREDYVAQLNTELLSGKGDDIVITSAGLPLGQYIKMGIFEDLSGYLAAAEEINEENYYMNLFDAYRTASGALYQMPISACAIPIFTFPTELVENTGMDPTAGGEPITWREALDAAEEMYDASTLPNTVMLDGGYIAGPIFNGIVASCVDYESGTVNVDKEKITAILGVFEEMAYFQTYSNSEGEIVTYRFGYTPDYETAYFVASGKEKGVQWETDSGKVCLSPYYAYDFGINSQSENKELAWEFLRFLVSEEVQTLPSCPNAGVCRAGLRARVEGSLDAGSWTEENPEVKEKVVQLVDTWVSQITGYYPEDTDILQIADGVYFQVMDGSLTAEEAADEVEKKLKQFISQ